MNPYGDAMRQLYGTGTGTDPILVAQGGGGGVSMNLPGGGGTQPILVTQPSTLPASHPMMQRPQALGGYRTAPGQPVPPMAPIQPPTVGDPRTLMQGQDTTLPPAIGDPRTMLTGNNDGNQGVSAPGTLNNTYGGPSAGNMYATYLQNQQAGLNSYLTGQR